MSHSTAVKIVNRNTVVESMTFSIYIQRHRIFGIYCLTFTPCVAHKLSFSNKGKGIGSRLESRFHDNACSTDFIFPLASWAPMQPATIDPTLDLCTRYPLQLGGPIKDVLSLQIWVYIASMTRNRKWTWRKIQIYIWTFQRVQVVFFLCVEFL